ncbi:hypothetical protein LCGC14_1651130 [marine sediment metagenome]|uniref:Uncharacterized protein n=1 Tax=marine sediment metagenome TaxID=412755 RepID=A0A0F9KX18_9ZZZZ
MRHVFFLLADGLDPTKLGETLGQAQSVQQVLGVIVSVLIVVVLALVTWYLRERKAWGEEKVELIRRWGEAKLKWEQERGTHAGQLTEVANKAADGRENLMREMLDLSLRIEKALDRLAEWKKARGGGT